MGSGVSIRFILLLKPIAGVLVIRLEDAGAFNLLKILNSLTPSSMKHFSPKIRMASGAATVFLDIQRARAHSNGCVCPRRKWLPGAQPNDCHGDPLVQGDLWEAPRMAASATRRTTEKSPEVTPVGRTQRHRG